MGPRWSVLLHPRDFLLCEDALVVLTRHHPAPGTGNFMLLELFWKVESAALKIPANLENSAVSTGLEKFSFKPQRKAMPKNVQTTT